ncbi:hypothetical protein [Accumulibacter sp.]|uniref:hypothetical protein n=1 Tax=Accumulibacter sp. TaxID=2053492 RepID=UPI002631ED7B|nr:hypothetical protein [Accumulibacter sp.]
MPSKRHPLPAFLVGMVEPVAYEHWLGRKAAAHLKRDRQRGYEGISGTLYRDAIHEAVVASGGHDHYTGEALDWSLLSRYNNDESHAERHGYKAGFALLPTVDHVESARTNSGFRICGWRTNDAKHDLSHAEFVELCLLVVKKAGFTVARTV